MGLRTLKTFRLGALFYFFTSILISQPTFSEANPQALNLATDNRLNSSDVNRLRIELEKASLQLPTPIQQLLAKRQVQIVFATAPKKTVRGWVSGTGIFGDKRNIRKIHLNESFISQLQGDSTDKTIQELIGTVIHEVGHVYDESQRYLPSEMPLVQQCNQEKARLLNNQLNHQNSQQRLNSSFDVDSLLSFRCRQTLKKWKLVSDSYRYQMLAGFKEQIFNKNISDARAADPYETVSSSEHFAENFRLFITDSEYQCRRPAFYRFFSEHFLGFQPFGSVNECPLKLRLANSGQLISIDRQQIYEVQYLLAGKGDNMESRFGHSLLRLVVCKQGRPLGPDCRLDLDDHLTIALLGDVDDLRMNPLKGVFGLYNSSFYVTRFRETLREYNKDQFRTISSFPLKFKRGEVLQLVDLIAQNYWEYRGKYYFFGRNCATELGEVLRAAIDSEDFLYDSNMTPNGLLKSLVRANLADPKNFEFFKSHKEKLAEQWKQLSESIGNSLLGLESYLALSAEERLNYFNKISAEFSPRITTRAREVFKSNGPKDALALYLMIPAVFSLLENQLADKGLSKLSHRKQSVLVRFIEKNEGLEELKASNEIRNAFAELRKIRSELRLQNIPDFLGYGIPTEQDLSEISAIVKELKARENTASRSVGLALDALFEDETSEISQIISNRNLIVDTLKNRAKQFRNEIVQSANPQ